MKATETNLLEFLKEPKQFVIPIYQRTYSWTLQQCEQLWHDIIKVAEDTTISGHFLGSVVYIEHGLYQVASLRKLLVIDGQQRLTTLCLLLTALGKAIENSNQDIRTTRKKIENYFLFNSEEENEDRYKLLLTQSDKKTFIKLIEDQELPEQKSQRIWGNYQYFDNQIRKTPLNLNTIYTGISKLIIVDISLDRERDNPQLIFESLNSTGLDLSQADLIRNYILMDLESNNQERIYNNYWYSMERNFSESGYIEKFDQFMRYYLTIKSKSGTLPNIRDIYSNFKDHVRDKLREQPNLSIEEIVKDIYRFSKYFVYIAFEKESDPEIQKAIKDINYLKVDVAYPFLLEVYDDLINNFLNREEFVNILRLLESYVFRRAICGIPPNSMNKTFASLSREIDKTNYLQSFQTILASMRYYKRFPNNEEFRREFLVKDVYHFRGGHYLLLKLENYDRLRELVNVEGCTIEHIMPQNPKLSLAWQQDLGEKWKEIHSRYLHTIGNLTLTGYNSRLSDLSFLQKRNQKDGFADSPLRLNKMLANLEYWNESEIIKRGDLLADIAIKVWSFPSVQIVDNEPLNLTNKNDYDKYINGENAELFTSLRQQILNLDASIREEFKKQYIAYKTATNFTDIVPLKSSFRIFLNMKFESINDPKKICRDVTKVRHWGNGDVEIKLSSLDQLEYVIFLIRQAFNQYSDES